MLYLQILFLHLVIHHSIGESPCHLSRSCPLGISSRLRDFSPRYRHKSTALPGTFIGRKMFSVSQIFMPSFIQYLSIRSPYLVEFFVLSSKKIGVSFFDAVFDGVVSRSRVLRHPAPPALDGLKCIEMTKLCWRSTRSSCSYLSFFADEIEANCLHRSSLLGRLIRRLVESERMPT